MHSRRLRTLIVGAVATALVGSGAFAASSATAATKAAVSPIGYWTAQLPVEATGSTLLFVADPGGSTKNGSWQFIDFGDAGNWVFSGTTVAMFVVTGPDAGMVLLGTVGVDTITGDYARLGVRYAQWRAIPGAKPALPHSRGTNASRTLRIDPSAKAAGTYTARFPAAAQSSKLTITNDRHISTNEGAFVLAKTGETGTWVTMGTHFAMAVTSLTTNAYTVYIGRLTSTGISSAAKPGLYPHLGVGVFPWYATLA